MGRLPRGPPRSPSFPRSPRAECGRIKRGTTPENSMKFWGLRFLAEARDFQGRGAPSAQVMIRRFAVRASVCAADVVDERLSATEKMGDVSHLRSTSAPIYPVCTLHPAPCTPLLRHPAPCTLHPAPLCFGTLVPGLHPAPPLLRHPCTRSAPSTPLLRHPCTRSAPCTPLLRHPCTRSAPCTPLLRHPCTRCAPHGLHPGPHRSRSRSINWQTPLHTTNPKFPGALWDPSVLIGRPECLAVLEILAILAAFWEPPVVRPAAICGGLLGRRPR